MKNLIYTLEVFINFYLRTLGAPCIGGPVHWGPRVIDTGTYGRQLRPWQIGTVEL